MNKQNALHDWLIGLVHCPNSRTDLLLASDEVMNRIHELHRLGVLCTKLGRTISHVPTQGLVSSDGRWFYPIANAIPCLLPEDAWDLKPEDQEKKSRESARENTASSS